MLALLSIKPEFVSLILAGQKRYEFRRQMFKRHVRKVYIYSSSPVKKVVASFTVEQIIEDSPQKLWKICKKESGIDHVRFSEYFRGTESAFAIRIGNVKKLKTPMDIAHIGKSPPQSFCYLETEHVAGLGRFSE